MMYLYAITNWPAPPLPIQLGLEDAPLLSLVYRDVAAVASQLAGPTGAPSPMETNLWWHEAVVEALMANRTVLPVRFGTVLADESALQSALMAHYADFVSGLRRVYGRIELSVQVLADKEHPWDGDNGWPTNDVRQKVSNQQAANDGHSYMLARLEAERRDRARHQQAKAMATQLHDALHSIAVESTCQVLLTPHLLLKAAYLIERERMVTFCQTVESLSLAYSALRFLCTGPWPPYNFVRTRELDDKHWR